MNILINFSSSQAPPPFTYHYQFQPDGCALAKFNLNLHINILYFCAESLCWVTLYLRTDVGTYLYAHRHIFGYVYCLGRQADRLQIYMLLCSLPTEGDKFKSIRHVGSEVSCEFKVGIETQYKTFFWLTDWQRTFGIFTIISNMHLHMRWLGMYIL